ncbi:S-layer homology domain-containing protein [Patescibacteria group bacterium]|nr:S-layer homology domain-containing protein [Patescibacteria group bacterium]
MRDKLLFLQKTITYISVVGILFAVSPVAFAADIPFEDHIGHDYEDAIEFLYTEAVLQGYADGTFKPDNEIKRAEFLKVIVAANFASSEYESFAGTSCFTDVNADEWFTQYVCFAKAEGIVQGYSDGTFLPDRNVTLNESLKMIYEGMNMPVDDPDAIFKFKYYSPAAKAGYLPDDLKGEYDKPMTRAEVSEVLYRILQDKDREIAVDVASVVNSDIDLGLIPYKQAYYASCGTAALAIALSGELNVSEEMIINKMITLGMYPNNAVSKEGTVYVWDNPQKVFVGDYNGLVSANMDKISGYGFLEDPLEILAKQWARNSEKFKGVTLQFIAQQLEEGNPVIVFANVNAISGRVIITEPSPYTIHWVTNDGVSVTAPLYKHNLVVAGYRGTIEDIEVFYIVDPFYGNQVEVTPEQLSSVLSGYDFSGVIVKF